jgi:putative hydrolase of the HAD superfamily
VRPITAVSGLVLRSLGGAHFSHSLSVTFPANRRDRPTRLAAARRWPANLRQVARFVIFDLFNTLIHGADEDRERVVAQIADTIGVDPAALIGAYNDTWPERQTKWGIEQTVRILAARLGGSPTPAQVTEAAELRRAFARRIVAAAEPGTIAVLDSLRAAGTRLALVSNATADSSEAWPGSALASRFEVAIFSCDVGVTKPDPRIYQAATTGLRAEPGQCCFVGDGADQELAGATALGMTVFRTTQYKDSDPAWPGPAISSLAALPPLLPADQ